MRVIKNPEERRNDILDAAETLFVTRGYNQTTINDILRACEIAKGTFYHYFQSKEDVMDAIVMRFVLSGEAAAQRIADDPSLSAHDKIFRLVTGQHQNTGNKHGMIEQLHRVNNVEMHQKSLVETVLRLSPILAKVVEQGVREGVFHTDAPQEMVEFLLVSSQFLLDQGIFKWEEEELSRKISAFVIIVERVLGAAKGSFAYLSQLYLSQGPGELS